MKECILPSLWDSVVLIRIPSAKALGYWRRLAEKGWSVDLVSLNR